jgi:putative hemolysin
MAEAFVILILIFLNGIFSMAEIAMISVRKSKLQSDADKGDKSAGKALRLTKDTDKFLSTVQVGITLVGILTGIFSGASIAESFSSFFIRLGITSEIANVLAKTIIVLIVMYFSILFGELLPKRIAMANPEKAAEKMSGFMNFFSWLAKPVVLALAKSTAFFVKHLGIKDQVANVTEEEIKSIIREGTQDGEVTEIERNIVDRVFTLGDLSVSNIMTLRDDIVCLDINMTENQIKKTIENNIFEQYPVVDGDLDHVEGVLSLKDYVVIIGSNKTFNLKATMKEPIYFHENMSVYAVLENMKMEKINRALVCDEFGSLSGIISLKDILDALVGNVSNSHQKEPDIVARKDGRGWFVDGQCSIYDFLTHFDLDESMEDYDFSTVGGLIMEIAQHVPVEGEKIDWKGFTFEVADMDGARIDKVLVTKDGDKAIS